MNPSVFILFFGLVLVHHSVCEDQSELKRTRSRDHGLLGRRRWHPRLRQSRHPLRDIFFPAEAVFTSVAASSPRRRSHEKRDAINAGSEVSDGGDAEAGGASVKTAPVFFNPAGSGVALDANG